ncbi:hypothetical protein [Fodinicola acaciae]|uniref:hypothetical protein n=1 Tax=Fodinicola acaciae TaxID=2681555 RepID=UPI0013D666AF|nr:hypothetical protein [Fodinicola acaciae]
MSTRVPTAPSDQPSVFYLWRTADVSGVSGCGLVAWGVKWPNGRATTQWNGESSGIWQTSDWDSAADVLAIHGHSGATQLFYLENQELCSPGPLVVNSTLIAVEDFAATPTKARRRADDSAEEATVAVRTADWDEIDLSLVRGLTAAAYRANTTNRIEDYAEIVRLVLARVKFNGKSLSEFEAIIRGQRGGWSW